MRTNRFIYFLFIIASFVFTIAYKSKLTTIILAVAVAYPLAALLLTLLSSLFVTAAFVEGSGVYEKNTPFEVDILITNRFVFPYVPLELVCRLPDGESGVFEERLIFASIAPLGKSKLAVSCQHKYRGQYDCEINAYAVYDPFRIIRIPRKLSERMSVVFLPRKISLGEVNADYAGEQSASPVKFIEGEREDFSHVREYRMGDIIQLVHWKLTAKLDELMIKQFDTENSRKAVVLCDYTVNGGSDPLLCCDMIVESTIAFVQSLYTSGMSTEADLGALDISAAELITDDASFARFYELMAVLPRSISCGDFCELVESVRLEGLSAMFIVTSRLDSDIIARAERAAEGCPGVVFLAYVNPDAQPVADELFEERFLFMNICGTDVDAIAKAAMAAENSR